jgi:hypothetical protein
MVEIIGTKDPNEFRNRSILVTRRGDYLDLHPIGNPMTFQEMQERRKPVGIEDLYSAISDGGHVLANVGVGGILTISLNGKDYLLGVNQYRPSFDDYVFNIVSGGIDSKHLDTPVSALEEEVSEEVLPTILGNQLIRFTRDGNPLPRPFQEYFDESGLCFDLIPPANYSLINLWQNLTLVGKPITGNPGLYFDPKRNTAQLVFSHHIDTGIVDMNSDLVTLNQSEDFFNKSQGVVEARYYPAAIILIELERGKLTDRFYHFDRGNLIPVSKDVLKTLNFGSKFNLDRNAIGKTSKISLYDFLNEQ